VTFGASFTAVVDDAVTRAIAGASTVILGPPGAGVSTVLRRIAAAVERPSGSSPRFVRFPDVRFPADESAQGVAIFDDAHLADDVQQLAVRDVAVAGPVVIGLRSGVAPTALSWLWRSGIAERVELDPLDADEIEDLIEQRIGGPVHRSLVAGLTTRSGGRPGFVVDEIESMRSLGAGVEAGFVRDRASGHVRERLVERAEYVLAELPAEVAATLRFVAAAGTLPDSAAERLDLDTRDLVRRRIAVSATDAERGRTGVSAIPPALASGIRSTLSVSETNEYGRAILAVENDLAPVDRARLRLALGEELNLDEVAAAAWAAIGDRALDSALALAESASNYGPRGVLLAAEIFTNVGARDEAANCHALLMLDAAAEDGVRARAAVEYATTLLWDFGRAGEAVAVAEGLAAATVGGPLAPLGALHEAAMKMYAGRPREADRLLSELSIHDFDGTWRRVFHMVHLVTTTLVAPGTPAREDLAALTAATEIGPGGTFGPAVGVIAAELALECAGDWVGAEEVVSRARRDLQYERTPLSAAWMALAESRAALGAGRLAQALRSAAESAAGFADINHPSGLRWAVGAGLLAGAQSGDREATRTHLERFEGLENGAPFLDADLLRARGWAAWALGDAGSASAHLADAASLAREIGSPALEAVALHDAFRVRRAPVGPRLDELSVAHPAPSIELRARHLRLVGDGAASELVELAGEFAERGATLIAAEVAADAVAAARAEGRRSTAREADGLRARLVARCGQVATPRVVGGGSALLTDRERDVATRVATGSSSKAVAEELALSVRTVDNVLQRVYIKLGIHGRSELVAAMTD
jgi:DNA-binding CsgD family transcriptional regulator